MTWLRQTFPTLNDPLATLVFWAIVLLLIFAFFTWIVPFFTRNTKTEIDDIIISVLRAPVMIIVVAYALLDVLGLSVPSADSLDALYKTYSFVLIWVSTWLFFQLIRDVVSEYLKDYADESESSLDDVLVPLIRRASPIIVLAIALFISVGTFSPELLAEVLTFVGAFSFLLVFLFQEPLSNLFSGVYLWIDTPFKHKDLIQLEDGYYYQVDDIGARVTKLYNTEAHTVAFFPNNKLAEQRLINVTRPNVELRQGIDIGIAYKHPSEEIEKFMQMVPELANRHVHVLGPWDSGGGGYRGKKELLEEEIKNARSAGDTDTAGTLEREMSRLEIEYRMRDDNQRIWEKFITLAEISHKLEDRGFNKNERLYLKGLLDAIRKDLIPMRRDLTVWIRWNGMLQAAYKFDNDLSALQFEHADNPVMTTEEWIGWLRDHLSKEEEQKLQWFHEKARVSLVGEFSYKDELLLSGLDTYARAYAMEKSLANYSPGEIQKLSASWEEFVPPHSKRFIRSVDLYSDFEYLMRSWSSAIRRLNTRLDRVERMILTPGASDFRVDSELKSVAQFFSEKFMLEVPGFRYPDVDFVKYGESSVDFRLEFFVDDLIGEHFERLGDVVSDVGILLKLHLDITNIEIPFPQRDIWFKNLSHELSSRGNETPSGKKNHENK
jgi:small-conductance mechanosensitive channel